MRRVWYYVWYYVLLVVMVTGFPFQILTADDLGERVTAFVSFLALAMALLLHLPPRRSARSVVHGTLPGAARHTSAPAGIVFPAKDGAVFLLSWCGSVLVATGLALLLGGARDLLWRATGVLGPTESIVGGVALLALGVAGVVLGRGPVGGPRQGIALFPEGIYLRGPLARAWLRWEDAARVGIFHHRNQFSCIGLAATARDAIVLHGGPRRRQMSDYQRTGADASYWVALFWAEPKTIVNAIRYYYWADPLTRNHLADPAAADPESVRALRPPSLLMPAEREEMSRKAEAGNPEAMLEMDRARS